jgi:hypothetical protein
VGRAGSAGCGGAAAFCEGGLSLTKALDPTRPVIGNDGWESVATDIIAIHDYEADAEKLAKRYSHPAENIMCDVQDGAAGGEDFDSGRSCCMRGCRSC